MRRLFIFIFIFVCSSVAEGLPPIQEIIINKQRKALLIEKHNYPFIIVKLIFNKSGYFYDTEKKQGLARAVAASMLENSADKTFIKFLDELQELGIELEVKVEEENFIINLSGLSDNINPAVQLLIDNILSSTTADSLALVQSNLQNKLLTNNQDIYFVGKDNFYKYNFGILPYINNKYGTLATIDNITEADINNFKYKQLGYDNLTINVVGDLTKEQLNSLLKKLQALKGTSFSFSLPPIPSKSLEKAIVKIPFPGAQSLVYFSQNSVGLNDPNYYKALLTAQLLGGRNLNSFLMKEIRGKLGLTYGIYTDLFERNFANLMYGKFITLPSNVDIATQKVRQVVETLKDEGINSELFEDNKQQLLLKWDLLTSDEKLCDLLHYISYHNLKADFIQTFKQNIASITLPEFNSFLAEFLSPSNTLFIIIQGDENPKVTHAVE